MICSKAREHEFGNAKIVISLLLRILKLEVVLRVLATEIHVHGEFYTCKVMSGGRNRKKRGEEAGMTINFPSDGQRKEVGKTLEKQRGKCNTNTQVEQDIGS